MPELPEVEILVRHLDRLLAGRTIHSVDVRIPRLIRPAAPEEFAGALAGRRFDRVRRRGKHLLFELTSAAGGPQALSGHLGMTGRMFVQPADAPLPRHAAVTFDLGGDRWIFEDARRFGRLNLGLGAAARLGPEPLDAGFGPAELWRALGRSRRTIKDLLLDQRVIAGVGNIYASEAMHQAGAAPGLTGDQVTEAMAGRLHAALRDTLARAIETGLTAALDFNHGADGLFYFGSAGGPAVEERFRVYDRAGKPCLACGTAIRRIVQGGRSTYYCPQCQASAPPGARRAGR